MTAVVGKCAQADTGPSHAQSCDTPVTTKIAYITTRTPPTIADDMPRLSVSTPSRGVAGPAIAHPNGEGEHAGDREPPEVELHAHRPAIHPGRARRTPASTAITSACAPIDVPRYAAPRDARRERQVQEPALEVHRHRPRPRQQAGGRGDDRPQPRRDVRR